MLTIVFHKFILMAHFDLPECIQFNTSKGCDEESRRDSINTEKCYLLRGT